MTEFGYDPREGKLFVGQAAIDLHREAGGEPVSLFDLLEADDFPYDPNDYEPQLATYSREDAIAWGKWVLAIVQSDGEPRPLRTRHIRRMAALGIGPQVKRIEILFDFKINNFKEEIGSPRHFGRGVYTNWDSNDFFAYATSLHQTIAEREGRPRKLTRDDFQQAFAQDEGPGVGQIEKHIGGIAPLNEYLGYPDIYGWDRDDFVAWGARLLRVNGEISGMGEALNALSRRKRGPSKRTVINWFDSLAIFRDEASQELERQEAERAKRLTHAKKILEQGELPGDMQARSEDELLAARARLLIYRHYRREVAEYRNHGRLPQVQDAEIFVGLLVRYGAPRITRADIESTAVMLDVYGDLWPPPSDEALRLE